MKQYDLAEGMRMYIARLRARTLFVREELSRCLEFIPAFLWAGGDSLYPYRPGNAFEVSRLFAGPGMLVEYGVYLYA